MRTAWLIMLAATAVASAQPATTAAEILKRVAAAYVAKDFEFVTESTEQGMKMRTHAAFQEPNRFRMEYTRIDLDPPVLILRVVLDGSGAWTYLEETNKYSFIPRQELTASELQKLRAQDLLKLFGNAETYAAGSELLREETIEIAGTKIECYVVSVPIPGVGPDTWWISRQTFRVARMDASEGSAVFTTVRLNEPLAEELFQFSPPPGAQRIEP